MAQYVNGKDRSPERRQRQTALLGSLDEFVSKHMYIVRHNSRIGVSKRLERTEVEQTGALAVVKAFYDYEGDKGSKPSTYVTEKVVGEIRHLTRDREDSPYRGFDQDFAVYAKFSEAFLQANGRFPTSEESIQGLGWSEIKYKSFMQVKDTSKKSLDFNDELCKSDTESCDNLDNLLSHLDLVRAMKTLDEKERRFIALRYFNNLTQKEVGEYFHLSHTSVTAMEKKILGKLRDLMDL